MKQTRDNCLSDLSTLQHRDMKAVLAMSFSSRNSEELTEKKNSYSVAGLCTVGNHQVHHSSQLRQTKHFQLFGIQLTATVESRIMLVLVL